MGVFKKGNNYYIDYYVKGRRKREKIGPSKQLALTVLQKRKVEIAENKYLDKREMPNTTFDEMTRLYMEYSRINKRSYRSTSSSINNLKRFFSGKLLSEIVPLMIEKFKEARKEKVTNSTVNRDLACLKHMYTKAIEWGKAINNPAKKVKLLPENNRRLRYLTQEEIERLLSAAPAHLQPILTVALHTGMRKSEIFNLKWQNIDFNTGYIYVIQSKNNEKREIPINQTLANCLRKVVRRIDSEYVFCNREGKPYTDLKKSFHSTLKKAEIYNFRFHDLRHTFASHLVMKGVDLTTVRELLGHKDIKMTLRYSHLSPDHKKRSVSLLDSGFAGDMDTYMDTRRKAENSNGRKLLKTMARPEGFEPPTL